MTSLKFMSHMHINIVHIIKIALSDEDSRSSNVEIESVTEVDEL